MATTQAVELKPPVRRFLFTEESTMADLFATVNELELAGKPPFLKFLGTRGQIVAAEVLVHNPDEGRQEMGCVGGETQDDGMTPLHDEADLAEDNGEVLLPDPAHRIPDSEPVIWEGERTTWGSLSQNERMSCEVNKDGVLEGGYPI